ncbi:ABC transporter permease [Mycobacterium lepromatosis]|uniref:ABC transporter permease n=1 Tax=Mycobacterium lepromatosis TaxID=480418 RepID=UPI000B1CD567|nr:ABC transporter permease [Mycobacterium lepromatosis]
MRSGLPIGLDSERHRDHHPAGSGVAGSGATAIWADLGACTIREEIDATWVLGIDPIQQLVVPGFWRLRWLRCCLTDLVCTIGLLGKLCFLRLALGA